MNLWNQLTLIRAGGCHCCRSYCNTGRNELRNRIWGQLPSPTLVCPLTTDYNGANLAFKLGVLCCGRRAFQHFIDRLHTNQYWNPPNASRYAPVLTPQKQLVPSDWPKILSSGPHFLKKKTKKKHSTRVRQEEEGGPLFQFHQQMLVVPLTFVLLRGLIINCFDPPGTNHLIYL